MWTKSSILDEKVYKYLKGVWVSKDE